MKKLKSLLAALLAVTMALTATACGNTDGQQEGGVSTSIDPSTVLEENSDVIHAFGGGSSGGGYYTISNVLSQYFTDNGFGNFIAQPTTGGSQNGLLMQAGELDLAVINGARLSGGLHRKL